MNAPAIDTTTAPELIGSATYSPEDNKLRLYPLHRLCAEDYERVTVAGFKWAPRQELFVAPMWTPSREDLLLELCGELGDEDTSLVDRATERADRFEDYSAARLQDYENAHQGVKSIADMIPMGQPILVGHHSEKRARKNAERIENGMRRAVRMWDTAQYWERRAAGAVAAAKYKERPDVRARRIKTIEADRRKVERERAELVQLLKFWSREGITPEQAQHVANVADRMGVTLPDGSAYWSAWSALVDGKLTVEEIRAQRLERLPGRIEHADRWINHYNNRVAYERAMLQEAGGTAADKYDVQPGGRVLVRGEWCAVLRVNKSGGVISSVTTNRRYVPKVGIEDVQGYEPPTAEQAAAVKAATEKAPICNYPGTMAVLNPYHGSTSEMSTVEITKAEWKSTHADYKGTRDVPATDTTEKHRVRVIVRQGGLCACFITDEKRKDPPARTAPPRDAPAVEPARRTVTRTAAPQPATERPAAVDAMRDTLKAGGVQVVSAPQLFPTPPDIAARMVELLDVQDGLTVLEPSAGTGALLRAVRNVAPRAVVTGVEISRPLVDQLQRDFSGWGISCQDFLTVGTAGPRGLFDRIIMNPPFINGADIKHILHARRFLSPHGVLVALCAAGPRQHAELQPIADHWEILPAGSFKEQGTGVNVALLVIYGGGE